MNRFQELLRASLKSKDTEEWLDVYFTRPIGLVFALLWNRLGIHPNVITILSIFLGMAAGYMFYFTDLRHNLLGVMFLMLANFCDSTDGQMARLTAKKTLLGRVLDGFSGDVWFFCIYFALCLRMMGHRGALGHRNLAACSRCGSCLPFPSGLPERLLSPDSPVFPVGKIG